MYELATALIAFFRHQQLLHVSIPIELVAFPSAKIKQIEPKVLEYRISNLL